MNKKGSMFFTLDVFLAATIITMSVLILFSFSSTLPVIQDTKVILDDISNFMINSKMQNLNIQTYTGNRTPEINNLLIHEKISFLVHNDKQNEAQSLIQNITNNLVRSEIGFIYQLDDITIYNRTDHLDPILVRNQLVYNAITLYNYNNTNYGPNITRVIIWS